MTSLRANTPSSLHKPPQPTAARMPATPFFNTDCFGRLRHAAYDATTGRVVATDSASQMVWVIGADGYSASVIDGGFNFPDGVAVDSQVCCWVATAPHPIIQLFKQLLFVTTYARNHVPKQAGTRAGLCYFSKC